MASSFRNALLVLVVIANITSVLAEELRYCAFENTATDAGPGMLFQHASAFIFFVRSPGRVLYSMMRKENLILSFFFTFNLQHMNYNLVRVLTAIVSQNLVSIRRMASVDHNVKIITRLQ